MAKMVIFFLRHQCFRAIYIGVMVKDNLAIKYDIDMTRDHKGCYKILYNRFGINNQDEWSYNILYIMSYLMVEGKRLK